MMPGTVESLIGRWDEQQAAYITNREQRFDIMLDVVARICETTAGLDVDGSGLIVLDLACGPGSLSHRILERFPRARVLGIDYDPVLLTLASEWLGSQHGDRFAPIDADLASTDWPSQLPADTGAQIAVSSTALHWLRPAQLVALYETLGSVLPSNGIFMNADHLRYDPVSQPLLSAIAADDDRRTQHAAHARGVQTWDEWWTDAVAFESLAQHRAERERRFADRPPTPHAPLELHLNALRTAGFVEAGVIWRHYDDVVVLGRR